ncbi:hypothetical protein G9A89_017081 [Geosiphon pyriformis]|nr:hypothetical protein G9A89_017081 [Geosiphon pyriformis]
MPSEHSRSSSGSSVTSPIPTINVKFVNSATKPNGILNTQSLAHMSSGTRASHSDLLEIFNARINATSRDRSPSRERGPLRDKSLSHNKNILGDKRGKSPSGRPKSPSGDKLLDTPKSQDRPRSRSPGPKNNGSKNKESTRSKSPRSSHNSDNLTRSNSQDPRFNLSSSGLHPWIAPSLGAGSNNNSSKSSNRLSLPPNFADFNINVIRENNERWAKLNLTTTSDKESKVTMGNFSKTSSFRSTSSARPKLSVETFNSFAGGKPLQRTPSGNAQRSTGGSTSSSSPLLIPGGFPLMRSRSYNSAMDDVHRLSSKFMKELEKPHPLQHSWFAELCINFPYLNGIRTMYYDSKSVMTPGPKTPTLQLSYEENLQTIGTFNTVETFCRYFNWVKKPSQLEMNTNFHIFKDKIKPMWEDPANANGGKWVISMRNPQLLDRCWSWLVYSLVGEELDENDDICGAGMSSNVILYIPLKLLNINKFFLKVMSRRTRGDRIAVWVRDKDNVAIINGIGMRLLKILDLQYEKGIGMDFQFNEDALKSGTSYNNRVYLSLESLKQELENSQKAQKEAQEKANSQISNLDDTENLEQPHTEMNLSAPDIITIDVDAIVDDADQNTNYSGNNFSEGRENDLDYDMKEGVHHDNGDKYNGSEAPISDTNL